MLIKRIVIVYLAVFFASVSAHPYVMRFTEEELTLASENVVRGEVIKKESFWNEKKTVIYTRVTIKKEESLKGEKDSKNVEVMVLGGKVGERAMIVSDMPRFDIGEEVLLFMRKNKNGHNCTIGGWQGKKMIRKKRNGKLHEDSERLMLKIKRIIREQR